MKQSAKRIVSLILCLTMIVGMMPAFAIGAWAAESGTQYLMFATDRHANTNIIGNIINNIENSIGENQLDYLALGGDMVGSGDNHPAYNSSVVLSEVTGATSSLTADNVDIVAGIHDMNVTDDAGIVLPYQGGGAQIYKGDGYYVYGVEEYCISEDSKESIWSAQADAFVTWANGDSIDKSAVIFISSHYPLHAKRDDNDGAYYWHKALNSVATGGGDAVERNIVFFHGHNHTEDGDEYVYNVGDTMSIQNGSSTVSDTIYYTYATAGYLNQNSKATLVTLTDDQIVLKKYTTSGAGETMATVTRVVDSTEEETTTPSTEATTEPSTEPSVSEEENVLTATTVTVPGYGNTSSTEVWKLTDTVTAGTYLIVNTNTAGSGYALLNNNGTVSAVEVNVANDGTNTYIELDNANAEWTVAGTSGSWTLQNGSHYLSYTYDETEGWFGSTTYSNFALAISTSSVTWASDGNNLYFQKGTGNAYGLTYSNGWTLGAGEYSWGGGSYTYPNVYFYTPETITTGTSREEATYGVNITVDGAASNASTVTGVVSGKTQQLGTSFTSTVEGQLPSGGTYTWSAGSDNGVASVDSNGLVTFTGKAGTETICVSYTWSENNASYTVTNYIVLTAELPVYGMGIDEPETNQIKIGAAVTLTAAAYADSTAIEDAVITWTSSDESIATVDADGVVTGVAAGYVIITATWTDPNGETHTDTETIAVVDAVYALDLREKVETTNEDGTTTTEYVSITKPIVIKDVDNLTDKTYSVWAYITADGVSIGDLNEEQLEKLTFISSNENIATVDKTTGTVTFTGAEGTVQITAIYEYADGKSVTDTVTFSISKEAYMLPADGTDDFPTYPDEGAIRIDKTAVAQGNFSQTGIAQVELSMTGVPYTTGNEMDVVVMLDMTGSMSDNGMEAAEEATKAFVAKIVKNEDGTYNDNRVAVYAFNSGDSSPYELVALGTINSDSELETANTAIDTASNKQSSGGTPFDEATKQCYDVLQAAKTTNLPEGVESAEDYSRQQFCVFMSDGGPTTYYGSDEKTYYGGNNNSGDVLLTSCMSGYSSSDSSDWSFTLPTEYYTDLLKADGVTVYTVGLLLQTAPENPAPYSSMTDSTYDSTTDSLTTIGSHYYFTSSILKQMASDSTKYIDIFNVDNVSKATAAFTAIAQSILEAAKDVVVEDKIDSHYTMNFKLPNTGVTADEAGMSEFYIQAVEYTLDETTHERTGSPVVKENFTFNADGTLKSHTVDGAACGDSCGHVTFTDSVVTAIDGTYFDYTIDESGDEFLTWNAEKLTTTELALQYFVYLDKSAGYDADQQVDAGTYNTNEYAHITYTNFQGNRCRKEFPIPSMTWMGAQVTYVFYLVNENGEPVNTAGRVVPFAEAVYVTNPVTYDVTWNEAEGIERLDARYLALDKVPEVYSLYDEDAYYEILVYQTEGVDEETKAVNYNHFIIEGSSTVTNQTTTKVFNTKAGTKYDAYGAYSATAGSYTSTKSGSSYTATVTTDIDYANTTVAFAVVWTPGLVEDTVVVDYGLDVVIDVSTNDNMASGVVGVRANKPSNVTMNSGTYDAAKLSSVDVYIDANNDSGKLKELKIGTATVESMTSVRFSLDKDSGMQFTDAAVFYYESDVNYYDENNELVTKSMYSSVTVIPATTVYYEDDFISYNIYDIENGQWTGDSWTTDGTAITADQDQDRPGADKIGFDGYDADNNYGYDSAYADMDLYSMGAAKMVNVSAAQSAAASFTFYGTGFDVISMTSNGTGTIMVDVYAGDVDVFAEGFSATAVKTRMVDTYYGYAQNEAGEWVTSVNDPNAVYQVPVMKMTGLSYGQYTVRISAVYADMFDHNDSDSYNFYLDAIRIYDPTGGLDDTAQNAYVQDGEGWPVYEELRNNVINASDYEITTSTDADGNVTVSIVDNQLEGAIFIDSNDENWSIADYVSYGPNNELYLDNGQAIAFNVAVNEYVADVQLGIKMANGETVTYEINGDSYTVDTTTDLYYSIKDYASGTIVIENVSGGILSLTNIKVTYTQDPASLVSETSLMWIDEPSAAAAVMSLRSMPVADESETEATEPETEATEPETEATEPETEATEPETEATEPETEVTEPETEATEPETEETVPETTEPSDTEAVVGVIVEIIKKLFGWLFG